MTGDPEISKSRDSSPTAAASRKSRYLRFDGMTWPDPSALAEAQWRIVYGEPTRADLLLASSVIGAYTQLVSDPQRRRNEKIAGIRAAMRGAS